MSVSKIPIIGAQTDIARSHTPAEISLATLNTAISQADPKLQMEIRYVEERLHFLLQRYGDAAIYALMRANLQVTIEKGQ